MTKVMARYFPAEVRLPGAESTIRTCRVYVTDDGELHVFTAPLLSALQSPIDFGATPEPPPVHPPQTWEIVTAAGLVKVTPQRGCGCGHPLKRWQPDWAAHLAPWRAPT